MWDLGGAVRQRTPVWDGGGGIPCPKGTLCGIWGGHGPKVPHMGYWGDSALWDPHVGFRGGSIPQRTPVWDGRGGRLYPKRPPCGVLEGLCPMGPLCAMRGGGSVPQRTPMWDMGEAVP